MKIIGGLLMGIFGFIGLLLTACGVMFLPAQGLGLIGIIPGVLILWGVHRYFTDSQPGPQEGRCPHCKVITPTDKPECIWCNKTLPVADKASTGSDDPSTPGAIDSAARQCGSCKKMSSKEEKYCTHCGYNLDAGPLGPEDK